MLNMYLIIQTENIHEKPKGMFGIIQQFNDVSKSSVTICPSAQPLQCSLIQKRAVLLITRWLL